MLVDWYSAALCIEGNLRLTVVLTPRAEEGLLQSLLLMQLELLLLRRLLKV